MLAISLFIDKNQIAKIRSIFQIQGKKLDLTECLKSAFTSSKFIKIFPK
jgi:hypothetical protein